MSAPAVILVTPQLGENIGSAARVMANFGLSDLRLAAPRDGWPNPRALPLAAGALDGPVAARAFPDLAAALADRTRVLAATARGRDLPIPVYGPGEAVADLAAHDAPAIVFGPESSGLENADVARADAIVSYPIDPTFPSLNLAQAVAVFAYAWRARAASDAPPAPAPIEPPAAKAALAGLLDQVDQELDQAGFFWPPDRSEGVRLRLRAALTRAGLSEQEVRTLRGAVKALVEGPRRRAREELARRADAKNEARDG